MLSRMSVKKPYTVVVAVVLSLILGIVSFGSMTVDLLPSISLPYAIVITTYQGANPEMVEMVVTKPIEQTMASISNIAGITSTSSENSSMVMLEFNETTNMDSVTVDIRESLDMISGYWPDEVSNPIIMKINPNMMPIMVAAIGTKEDLGVAETSEWVENQIISQIESVEGVASVTTIGSIESTVEVEINPEKLKEVNKKVQKALSDTFKEAESDLKSAKSEITSGESKLDSGVQELADQKTELANALADLESQEATLKQSYQEALDSAYASITSSEEVVALQEQIDYMKKLDTTLPEEMSALSAQYNTVIETAQTQAKAAIDEQFDPIFASLTDGKVQLTQGVTTIDAASLTASVEMAAAKANLSSALSQVEEGEKELEKAKDSALDSADLSNTITVDTISGILMAQNFSMPAGYVQEGKESYLVRVGNKFESIEDMLAVPLFNMGFDELDTIVLGDVAEVHYATNEEDVYASINGEPGVMVSIQLQTGYATGDVSKNLNEKFDSLKAEDENVDIAVLMDQGVYIDLIVDSVMNNIVYGSLLAILVLIFFLRSLRTTAVIAFSMPISIIIAIVLMYFSGITLNIISLSGLALGVGMLVDNSIVVIENIYRMRNEEGLSRKSAAIKGANQVAGAIIASTLTTVCVFLPIVFVQGITRQLFVDMGLTIAYSLLASLIVALTVVPMMLSTLLKKGQQKEGKVFTAIKNAYGKSLAIALKVKFLVIIGAMGLLVASVSLAMKNGMLFMPEMESTQITMSLKTESGSTLEETRVEADAYIEALLEIKDVKDVGAMASSGNMMGMGAAVSNKVDIYAILNDDFTMTSDELNKAFLEAAEDINAEVTISMSSMDMSALGGSGVAIKVKGKELDTLQEIALDLAAIVEEVEGTENVLTGLEDATEELRVVVDKDKATEEGLMVAQVYAEIAGMLGSVASATTLSTESADYTVQVIDGEQATYTRDSIKELSITVTAQDGTKKDVKLADIATFESAQSLPSISRESQVRTMTVTAGVADGHNISFVGDDVKAAIADYELPSGYTIETSGEDDTIMETMFELMKMLGMAVLFMYLIMVAQFQSLKSPFIIMFTVPLAFTGGFLALWVIGMEVSAIAMVGFVMLSGIIVNNGIVLVDYMNQLIDSGMERRDAIILAGKTRLRSIVMTALTTILGLSTMAMGVGMGSDMMQPMAVVTIGGLIYGTLLTLFVVPCVYELFNRKKKSFGDESEGNETEVLEETPKTIVEEVEALVEEEIAVELEADQE